MKTATIRQITEEEFFKCTQNALNKIVYITKPWVIFLKSTIKGSFIAFEIETNGQRIYTYGFFRKILMFKLYCSPFEQWNTPYIGFFSESIITNYEFLHDFYSFLKKEYHINYFDVSDLMFNEQNIKNLRFKIEKTKNIFLDLSNGEESIFNSFGSHLRKRIRNNVKQGYKVVFCPPNIEFANLYYDQLIEVFERQNLAPFYSREKIIKLFNAFTGYENEIVCTKTIDPEGNDIGTFIHLKFGKHCIAFGSASFTDKKKDNMNHVHRWECIKYFINEGLEYYDFGGFNPYKMVFIPEEKQIYRLIKSNIPLLYTSKRIVKWFISLKRKVIKR